MQRRQLPRRHHRSPGSIPQRNRREHRVSPEAGLARRTPDSQRPRVSRPASFCSRRLHLPALLPTPARDTDRDLAPRDLGRPPGRELLLAYGTDSDADPEAVGGGASHEDARAEARQIHHAAGLAHGRVSIADEEGRDGREDESIVGLLKAVKRRTGAEIEVEEGVFTKTLKEFEMEGFEVDEWERLLLADADVGL